MLISVQTPAAGGTAYAQFAAQWCQNGNGYLLNDTGTSLDVKIGASASPVAVANGKGIPFKLVYNCNELFVRRTDQSTTQVTVEAQVGITVVPSDGGGTSGPVSAADITDLASGRGPLLTGTQAEALNTLGTLPQFTAAQLNALTTGNRPLVAYCTDCLVPEGVGSPVVWTGTAWVCTCSTFPVVTAWIDYFRAEYMRCGGMNLRTGYSMNDTDGSFASTQNLVTRTNTGGGIVSSAVGIGPIGYYRILYLGVANGASARWNGGTFAAAKNAALYSRQLVSVSNLSDANDGWDYRFAIDSSTGYTLPAASVGFALDERNSLGSLNAGNSKNWIIYARNASVNYGVAVTNVPPSTNTDTPTLLERVIRFGAGADFYIDGALVGTITDGLPTGTTMYYLVGIGNRTSSTGSGRMVREAGGYHSMRYLTAL